MPMLTQATPTVYCACPEALDSLDDLCPACRLDYETWRDTEAPTEEIETQPAVRLADWVYEQCDYYRYHYAGEPDIRECLINCLDMLHTQILVGHLTTTEAVYEYDRGIGTTWRPMPSRTPAGRLVMEEVERYRDLRSDAGQLIADVLRDMMQEIDFLGIRRYVARMHEVQVQVQRRLFCSKGGA